MLIDRCGKDLVLLKIPTKSLDSSKLKIRSQSELFLLGNDLEKNKIIDNPQMNKFLSEYQEKYGYKAACQKMLDMLPEKYAPLRGRDAKFAPLQKQNKKKADLEYIYSEDIPMSRVEVVGSCNIEKEFGENFNSISDRCKAVFEKFFKGKPEEKALKAWREEGNADAFVRNGKPREGRRHSLMQSN